MPRANTHLLVGAGVGALVALLDPKKHCISHNPILAAIGSAHFGRLPDILEPAFNPHHRQFFHSYAFAGLLSTLLIKTFQWKPESALKSFLRGLALVAGSAYLSHLICDAMTPKGLPIVGKI